MRIIDKHDKYAVINEDYTLMIGDADIALLHKNKVVWQWNFKSRSMIQEATSEGLEIEK
jgi:hypothetical protein